MHISSLLFSGHVSMADNDVCVYVCVCVMKARTAEESYF